MIPLWAALSRCDTSIVNLGGAGAARLQGIDLSAAPPPSGGGQKTWGQVAARAQEPDVVYRYVGPSEVKLILNSKNHTVPNTTKSGEPKDVSYTTGWYDSASEAERALLIGRYNPTGATESPTHRVTVLRNGPHWTYAGNSATNGPIELRTPDMVSALRIDPLGD